MIRPRRPAARRDGRPSVPLPVPPIMDPQQARRIRITVIALALLAAAFYAGFFWVMSRG